MSSSHLKTVFTILAHRPLHTESNPDPDILFFSGNFEFRATHHDLDVDMPHFHICADYKIAILATV